MRFEPARLRRGERVAGVGALALLICMFLLPWYGASAQLPIGSRAVTVSVTVDAWHGLTTLRWLMLILVLSALMMVIAQGALRAPAVPVTLGVIVLPLAILTALCVIDRVLFSLPGPSNVVSAQVGAYLGLLSTLAVVYGSFRSLREESRPDPARSAAIPVVTLRH
jgi:hypothetical protein